MTTANAEGTPLLTEKLRARIGETCSYTAPDAIGRPAIRYFAQAIGDLNPLYLDPEYARAHGHPDVIAPPTLICETNQYMTVGRDPDGSIGHSWHLDVPGTRVVRGGNSYEFLTHAGPATVLTVTWRIAGMTERAPLTARRMLIVTSVASYSDQHGNALASNTETLIFQPIHASGQLGSPR